MAEIVKSKEQKEFDLYQKSEKTINNSNKTTVSNKKNKKEDKKSLWERFMIFCHGVKNEAQKVRWTSKEDMVKYSIATIFFILFCCLFFYSIDAIFALIQSLFK